MSVKIIVTGKHSEKNIERFRSLPDAEVIFTGNPEDLDEKDLREAEMFAGSLRPSAAAKMPKLRFVQLFSAGAGNYAWLPEHVVLANAYGAYGGSIAEHMLTVTLMAMKRMPEYLTLQQEKEWKLLKDIDRFEGSRILSVGMGAIGTAYAQKASALGAECYGVRRTVHDQPPFIRKLVAADGMDELLPDMDVVALSLPGTDEVANLFDYRRLSLMKKSAILINVGRGNSVVTDDLIRIMNEGHLKAACLDVMDPEPLPPDHPLWTAPRVYLTPHISGGYRAGINYDRVTDVVIQNLTLVLQGKDPVHIVDRRLGY
ncbi:MAG: D-2-hydroxyacid dehydrogenase [Solobacterium sp.]|nr:D-2-hydroxyacid dehydrogenase [Solobacterium sp.]